MRPPLLRWLSLRVRLLCTVGFIIGSLLPPYVPQSVLSAEEALVPSSDFLFVEDGFLMKTSSLTQQASRLANNQGVIHTVKAGEKLEAIAAQYRLKPETIRWANNVDQQGTLTAGQELVILPVDGVLHTVRRGQTLSRIAELYDIDQDTIAEQNVLQAGLIITGQQLLIPGGKPLIAPPAGIASAEDTLQFTDRLSPRDIQLRLKEQQEQRRQQIERAQPAPAPVAAVPKTPPASVTADATNGTLQLPCNECFFTQYYHPGHYAVDIQTRGGGPIFAAEAGTIIRADLGWNGGYGNVIEVDHGNGLITLYGHNKELYVAAGDQVARGDIIAWMGNTGLVYGQTGIHTHFEVHVNGVKKNPLLYLD